MRKFFAVKGLHSAERIVDIGGKAHIVTEQGTFKMRDNMHSNTFLVGTAPILKIYDLSPVDYREVYNSLEPCSIYNIEHTGSALRSFDGVLSKSEIEVLKNQFYLVEKGECLGRLEYSDVIKLLQYVQSLEDIEEFNLHGSVIRDWVVQNFGRASGRNVSFELGFFILLRLTNSCTDLTRLDSFLSEWRKCDLFEPRLREFLAYLDSTFIKREEKSKIKNLLSRFA